MILNCSSIHQYYKQGDDNIHILKGIDFKLDPGEIVALVGSSGSGKSTFLHVAGLLEAPTSGTVTIDGQSFAPSKTSSKILTDIRRTHIGFIYQFHHLLPEFTALENVMLPLILQKISKKVARDKAAALLEKMGLIHRLNHLPPTLSGGEQQRVAIARAIIHSPKILLADEPTGNLDNETATMVFEQLLHLIREHNLAALIATHDTALAGRMDRTLHLNSGVLKPKDASS
jgi:lipoprotein-releasing system ATP-binding protein